MHLKQLEINGFKSFLKETELNFTEGINAIVGPNGSGKSNIADAVRWVIGEQSVKTLRGNKMEDVIFSGSEKTKASGFAEVTLILDNSDKGINLAFNEISITRRMYRSGESEYYINKSQCRLKDITEIFMDTGVGKDGYSIIGQGKIDEILNNKADDRRAIFEEAAGISKYKYRKQESERKMEYTRQNIVRLQDILQEVESQLMPMAEQAEITKRYQKLIHELKILDVNLILINSDKNNKRLRNILEEIEALNNYKVEKEACIHNLEEKLSKSKGELKGLEVQLSNLNQKIYEITGKKDKHENEKNILKEKTLYTNDVIEKLNKEINELNEEKNAYDKEIEGIKSEGLLIELELDKLNNLANVMDIEYNEKYSSITDLENKIEAKKQVYLEYITKQSEIKSNINLQNERIKNINDRIKQINFDKGLLVNQCKEREMNKEQVEAEIKSTTGKIDNLKKVIDKYTQDKKSKENQIQNIQGMLIEIRSKKDKILSRLKLLEEMEKEYGGYNKTIKSLLSGQHNIKDKIKGFKGVIGELISVPTAYSTAIEAALGSAVQNIVTENENDAKDLIGFLKRNNMGRATFLPISSIKPKRIRNDELNKLERTGFVGIAAELVKCDDKYKDIIYYLLGRVIVADTIDTAIRLGKIFKNELKIVTLDGEIFSIGGAITGGSKPPMIGAILTRKNQINELKKEYNIVLNELEELDLSLDKQKEEHFNIDDKIAKLIEELHTYEISYSNFNSKLIYINNELELSKSKMDINEKDIEELENEIKDNRHIIDNFNTELVEAINGSETLSDEIKRMEENIRSIKNDRDEFTKVLTEYKIKIAELKQQKSAIAKTIDSILNSQISINNKVNNNIDSVNLRKNELDSIKDQIGELDIKIIGISSDLLETQNEYKSAEEQKYKKQESIESEEGLIKQYGIDLTNLQNSLHKADLQKTKAEIELESLNIRLLETYELNYNKATSLRVESFNISQSVKRIEYLKKEIKDLGTVNVNAVEEFDRLNNRHIFLKNQLEDLEIAKASLTEIIEEITAYMKKQFLEEFEKINKNFNDVFARLFGGGTAQVELTDKTNVLESGIDIIVKPPNKKQQSLLLMSGGERALTAIALLFGILIMKPVPFCVLDEIDSALDDVNVGRYANYLKELSEDIQFIIITHRKGSMEAADCLYGVSMEDTGVSKLLSVRFEDKVS